MQKPLYEPVCHEMWEMESEDANTLYEPRALETNEEMSSNEMSIKVMDDTDSTRKMISPRSVYMTNRSLSLESSVQFASLVAAYHIYPSTRDRNQLTFVNWWIEPW
jgi:hypothetical protein